MDGIKNRYCGLTKLLSYCSALNYSMVGCKKCGGKGLFVIPAVIQNQGDKTRELSKKRRDKWIARIKRKDWVPTNNSRVCKAHFINGMIVL